MCPLLSHIPERGAGSKGALQVATLATKVTSCEEPETKRPNCLGDLGSTGFRVKRIPGREKLVLGMVPPTTRHSDTFLWPWLGMDPLSARF